MYSALSVFGAACVRLKLVYSAQNAVCSAPRWCFRTNFNERAGRTRQAVPKAPALNTLECIQQLSVFGSNYVCSAKLCLTHVQKNMCCLVCSARNPVYAEYAVHGAPNTLFSEVLGPVSRVPCPVLILDSSLISISP